MSELCLDLIRKMLDRDVERRIGIQGVLAHPWVQMEDEDEVGEAVGGNAGDERQGENGDA